MVDILFFAGLQEELGKDKLTLDIANVTVKELKDEHLSKYELDNLEHAMVAINEEYAQDTAIINDNDIVALIPPVSGG